MKKELIIKLTNDFDSYSNKEKNSEIEFWYARDLQKILGYTKWENFESVIKKAMISCETSKQVVAEHFPEVRKTLKMPNNATKDIIDYKLTRYACYLIAQNGDPKKEQIAFAQTYFAVQTRNMEIITQRLEEYERLKAREKLTESDKILSGLIYERGVDSKGFGIIKSNGDKALFGGYNTLEMKERLGIKASSPLADYLPTVTIKAKDLANEMTNHNLKTDNQLYGREKISGQHIKNNTSIRQALVENNIIPENLPVEENTKKLKRRLEDENKKTLLNNHRKNKKE